MTSKSYTKNPQSVNKFNVDRGVDLDTGRYWARYGDQYASFRTASERDQWLARWELPAVLAIAATGEKTAYTLAAEVRERMHLAYREMGRADRALRNRPCHETKWAFDGAYGVFQARAVEYATFAGRM